MIKSLVFLASFTLQCILSAYQDRINFTEEERVLVNKFAEAKTTSPSHGMALLDSQPDFDFFCALISNIEIDSRSHTLSHLTKKIVKKMNYENYETFYKLYRLAIYANCLEVWRKNVRFIIYGVESFPPLVVAAYIVDNEEMHEDLMFNCAVEILGSSSTGSVIDQYIGGLWSFINVAIEKRVQRKGKIQAAVHSKCSDDCERMEITKPRHTENMVDDATIRELLDNIPINDPINYAIVDEDESSGNEEFLSSKEDENDAFGFLVKGLERWSDKDIDLFLALCTQEKFLVPLISWHLQKQKVDLTGLLLMVKTLAPIVSFHGIKRIFDSCGFLINNDIEKFYISSLRRWLGEDLRKDEQDNDINITQTSDAMTLLFESEGLIKMFFANYCTLQSLVNTLPRVCKRFETIITTRFIRDQSNALSKFILLEAPKMDPFKLFCAHAVRKMFKSVDHLVCLYINLPSAKHCDLWMAQVFRGLDEFEYDKDMILKSLRAHYALFKSIDFDFTSKVTSCALIADCLVTSTDEAFYESIEEELDMSTARVQKILPLCKHGYLLMQHLLDGDFGVLLLTRLCIIGDESIPDNVKDILKETLEREKNITNVSIPFTTKQIRENFAKLYTDGCYLNKRSLIRVWRAFAEDNTLDVLPSTFHTRMKDKKSMVDYMISYPEQMSVDEFSNFLRWYETTRPNGSLNKFTSNSSIVHSAIYPEGIEEYDDLEDEAGDLSDMVDEVLGDVMDWDPSWMDNM
jgi:hypothetical protein